MLKKQNYSTFYQENVNLPAHTTQAEIFYQNWHLGQAEPLRNHIDLPSMPPREESVLKFTISWAHNCTFDVKFHISLY